MHLVTISDPWFGSYLRVGGRRPWGVEEPNQLLIGPLFTRTLRVESLNNQGKVIDHDSFLEKSCNHSWVEGTIDGKVQADGLEGPNVYWIGFGDFELTNEVVENAGWDPETGEPLLSIFRNIWKVSKIETDVSATLDYQFMSLFVYPPGHQYEGETVLYFDFVGSARFDRIEDKTTGAVEYRLVSSTSIMSGSGVTGFCEEAAPPFGSSGDNLMSYLDVIRDTVSGHLDDTAAMKDKMTARDEAIYDALNNIQIGDLNPLEEVGSLLAPLEPLMQLYKLVKIDSWIDVVKNLASLHLFWKYVVKSGLMSVDSYKGLIRALMHPEKVINEIRKKGLVGHGKSTQQFTDDCSETVVRHNAKLCYAGGEGGFDNLLDLLNMLGFTPRIADLWDIVPYSFVLDWVIPIGDAVNNLELNSIQQRLPFIYGVLGRKVTRTYKREFNAGTHQYSINLKSCVYSRTVIDEFPRDVWFGVSLHDPRKQLLTGGALLIQNLLS